MYLWTVWSISYVSARWDARRVHWIGDNLSEASGRAIHPHTSHIHTTIFIKKRKKKPKNTDWGIVRGPIFIKKKFTYWLPKGSHQMINLTEGGKTANFLDPPSRYWKYGYSLTFSIKLFNEAAKKKRFWDICNINFWIENGPPPPPWNCSKNSSDLVYLPFPKQRQQLL